MKEDFLHFIWQFQLFNTPSLRTVSGKELLVKKVGQLNTNAGPDFLDGIIELDGTTWHGHIEIHIKSSDWLAHKHQHDPKYKNVVLHAVLTNDREVFLNQSEDLETVVLQPYIQENYLLRYKKLLAQKGWIPCAKQLDVIDDFTWLQWKDRLLIQRLERKSQAIKTVLAETNEDWEETFYRILARNFGFKVNAEAFARLAEILPLKIIAKHRDSLFQIEALLYGQAGFLDRDFLDPYPQNLKAEYIFLAKKYGLRSMPAVHWKYLRMMPVNFPTVRIAQFAVLLYQTPILFAAFSSASVSEIFELLQIKAVGFWSENYRFEKDEKYIQLQIEVEKTKKSPKPKMLGTSSIENIIINTVVPFLFVSGRHKGEQTLVSKAFELLESCKSEQNTITRNWKKLGVLSTSAYESQALIELKNEYCGYKKCLSCRVGNGLLRAKQV